MLPEKYGIYDSPISVSDTGISEQAQSAIAGLGAVAAALTGGFSTITDVASEGFTCEYCMQPFNNEDTLMRHLGLTKVSSRYVVKYICILMFLKIHSIQII